MAGILHISEAVVTEEVLRRQHGGQTEVQVGLGAVVTPSGWDYLRGHRLRLQRGPVEAPRTHPQAPPVSSGPVTGVASKPAPGGPGTIPEVLPPGAEMGVLSRGRYDHPDRAFGCRTEEFGSGFVEPSSCDACAVRQAAQGGCGCSGCNKTVAPGGDTDMETLVQRLTDEIMARLGGA